MKTGDEFNPWRMFVGVFIPNALARYSGLTASAKLIYGRLAQFAGKNGECYPSQETLAAEVGLSTARIKQVLPELVKCGLIRIEQPMGRDRLNHMNARYVFLWHDIFAAPQGDDPPRNGLGPHSDGPDDAGDMPKSELTDCGEASASDLSGSGPPGGEQSGDGGYTSGGIAGYTSGDIAGYTSYIRCIKENHIKENHTPEEARTDNHTQPQAGSVPQQAAMGGCVGSTTQSSNHDQHSFAVFKKTMPLRSGKFLDEDACQAKWVRNRAMQAQWLRAAGHYRDSDEVHRGVICSPMTFLSRKWRDWEKPEQPSSAPPPDRTWLADLEAAEQYRADVGRKVAAGVICLKPRPRLPFETAEVYKEKIARGEVVMVPE